AVVSSESAVGRAWISMRPVIDEETLGAELMAPSCPGAGERSGAHARVRRAAGATHKGTAPQGARVPSATAREVGYQACTCLGRWRALEPGRQVLFVDQSRGGMG